jgi:hypothetical protein
MLHGDVVSEITQNGFKIAAQESVKELFHSRNILLFAHAGVLLSLTKEL